MTRPKYISVTEIFVFYGITHLVIWGGEKIRPTALVLALILIGICVASNKYHGDSSEKIGLDKKNFWPNFRLTFSIVSPLLLPLLIYGWYHRYEGRWDAWFSFLGYPFWAFAQEYVLLGFLANRWEDVWGENHILIPWINGFLFSLVHFPNPVLMTVTFISGVLFTWIFFKKRHLIPLALAHALFGVGISMALGRIYGIMSVGPSYLSRIGVWPY
jgi:membrane protease YdiL (CAAX protease family)